MTEVWIILSVIFLFMTSACIGKRDEMLEHGVAFGITFLADLVLVFGWVWKANLYLSRLEKRNEGIREWMYRNWGILLMLVFCTLTRVVQFANKPRWDALQYYQMLMNGCQEFDFSTASFRQSFTMASHPTLGFAALTAIGEFLNPQGYVGVLVMWLLTTLLAAVCVYRIFEKILPGCTVYHHMLATCTVMSTPLVLGTFWYYQPDAGLVCFFVFAVYSYLYRKNLLMFFSIVLLLMTKEIGIVVVGGFGLGVMLGWVLYIGKGRTVWQRFMSFFRQPLGICGLLAAVVLVVYFVYFFSSGGRLWRLESNEVEGFSTFGFQWSFIWAKLEQFFVLNFNWMIWGGNLTLGILSLVRWKRGRGFWCELYNKDILIAVFMTAAVQVVFYCLYVTYSLPRYHVLVDWCGVFLFSIFLMINISGENIQTIVTGAVVLILLIESYLLIDPVSAMVFDNEGTGNARVIVRDSFYKSDYQGDYAVYNHQNHYLDKCYENIFRGIDYHEGMDVIVWNNEGNYEIPGGRQWDTVKREFVRSANENSVAIRLLNSRRIEWHEEKLQREAVFVMVPQFVVNEEYA